MSSRLRLSLVALGVFLLAYFIAAREFGLWPSAPSQVVPLPAPVRPISTESLVEQPRAVSARLPAETDSKLQSVPAGRSPPSTQVAPPVSVDHVPAALEASPASLAPDPLPAQAPREPIIASTPEKSALQTPPGQVAPAAIGALPALPPQTALGARKLPERIALRYGIQSGEDGLTIGQISYSGQIRDGRYTLVSTTEATGITALFVGGKIIQRSEGGVTLEGLRPEVFTSAKGERKVKTARFDWAHGQLLLPFGGVGLPQHAQDIASFPFHLAMMADDADPAWTLAVTNGKNLLEYRFQVIGRETLALPGGRAEAVHLQGVRGGDARLDVWLAPSRDWLPVRIRTLDENGKLITMTLL